ncbi:MAG TPA: protein kinase [Gemmatimonadaceae bacterium]|jgi:serine/threonine-protein kinase
MSDRPRLTAALADRYRIERELGAGGMATVYLAEDLKHDRKVAIKVLKPELAAVLGAERFVVEIKTTAALQHPHILPLFDSGTADGFLFYVMPYIEGETIREKLNRETQFGVDEAVRIAREVADALDYAHRHGVIHRDIKPENILLHDGRAMVMDFGIALAVSAAAGGRMTETGLSLGTPHYMSPEQATAEKEITPRSDEYSLASVLYEMLAGQPPHIGGAAQQVIMKIITEPAELVTKYRKSVPEHVAAALDRALEKLPADRFESAKAFGDALGGRDGATVPTRQALARTAATAGWRQRLAVPAIAATLLLAIATAWLASHRAPPPPVVRYAVDLPEGKRLGSTIWSPMAVSPDGSKLLYMGETGRLFLRTSDQLDPVELAGTDGAFNPFFSPDGSHIGFMSGSAGSAEIKTMSLTGEPPFLVTATGVGGPGIAWGVDGYIYFDASGVGPLMRVRATGGESEAIAVRDSAGGELQHNWPDPLPNGRGVLMVVDRGGPAVTPNENNEIAVLNLTTRRHHVLFRGIYAKYAASGHILYVTAAGALMAVPFNADRLEVTGAPVALLEGINVRSGGGASDLAISRTGTLWYGAGGAGSQTEAVWASRTGEITQVDSGWRGEFGALALSPDGTRVAVSVSDATGQQIWVKQLGTPHGSFAKLTFSGTNGTPRWRSGGNELLFIGAFAGAHVRSVRADGSSAEPAILSRIKGRVYGARWSPDGAWLVYETFGTGTGRDIVAVRATGDSTVIPLAVTSFAEHDPSISPDGKWVLYDANTTGNNEVYVRPFPNAAAAVYPVSIAGGSRAKWSQDGKEIFFANANAEMVQAKVVVSGNSFTISDRHVLFPLRGVRDWDVAPGGRRFILLRDRTDKQATKLVVVENFFQELNAKVPR